MLGFLVVIVCWVVLLLGFSMYYFDWWCLYCFAFDLDFVAMNA